jgi:hypothetical protein
MTVNQKELNEITDIVADNWDTDPRHIAFKILEAGHSRP